MMLNKFSSIKSYGTTSAFAPRSIDNAKNCVEKKEDCVAVYRIKGEEPKQDDLLKYDAEKECFTLTGIEELSILNYKNYFPNNETTPTLPPLPAPDTLENGDFFICTENNIVDTTSGEVYYGGDLALIEERDDGEKVYIKINRQGGGITLEQANLLFVPKIGDTKVTGKLYNNLTLDTDPIGTLTTKSYVDSNDKSLETSILLLGNQVSSEVNSLQNQIDSNVTDISNRVKLSGDTMSGPLNIPSNVITNGLSVVNKDYVDGAVSVVAGGLIFKGLFSSTAPLPSALGQEDGYYYIATEDTTDQPSAVSPSTSYKGGDLAVVNQEMYVKVSRQGAGITEIEADLKYLSKVENTSTDFLVECTVDESTFTDNTLVTKKYVDDISNTKQDTITGAATTIVSNNLSTEVVVVTDTNGKISESTITNTELQNLSGVSGNIQTQFTDLSTDITELEVNIVSNSNMIITNQTNIQNNKNDITTINDITIPGLETNINTNSGEISSNKDDITNLNNTKVNISGDTMSGPLTISDANIIDSQSAVNKNYVDNSIDSIAGGLKFIRVFDSMNLPPLPAIDPSGSFYAASTGPVSFDGEIYQSADTAVVVEDALGVLSYTKIDRQGSLTEAQADLKYLYKSGDICTGKLSSELTDISDSNDTLTTKSFVIDQDTVLQGEITTNTNNISSITGDIGNINTEIAKLPPLSFTGEDDSNYITHWDSLTKSWEVDIHKVKAGKNAGIMDTNPTTNNIYIGQAYSDVAAAGSSTTGNQNVIIGDNILNVNNADVGSKVIVVGSNIAASKIGNKSIILGENVNIAGEVGNNTIIVGSDNYNSNDLDENNIVIGKNNFNTKPLVGTDNITLGSNNNGKSSSAKTNMITIGNNNDVSSAGSSIGGIRIGNNNDVSNPLIIMGEGITSEIGGSRSICLGKNNTIESSESIILGSDITTPSFAKQCIIAMNTLNSTSKFNINSNNGIIINAATSNEIDVTADNTILLNAARNINFNITESGNTYLNPVKQNTGTGTGSNQDRNSAMKLMTYNTTTKQVKYANKAWLNDINSNTSSINSLNTNFKYPRLSLGRPFTYRNGKSPNSLATGEFTKSGSAYYISFRDLNNFGWHNAGHSFTGATPCTITFCRETGNPYLLAGYVVTRVERDGNDGTGNYKTKITVSTDIVSSANLGDGERFYVKCSLFF